MMTRSGWRWSRRGGGHGVRIVGSAVSGCRCRRRKRVRDLGVSGRRTTLVWRRRRFWCGNCEERHLETYAEFEGGLSGRFARRLVRGRPADVD